MFELGVTLLFQDMEAKNAALNALKIVQDEGRMVELNGVTSISTSVKDGDMVYPFMVEEEITDAKIAPSIVTVPITFNTACGERNVNFRRYETSSEVILETDQSEIVFLKFVFTKDDHNVTFTYRMQSQFAKNSKDIAESYCSTLGIIDYFFKPNKEQVITESLETLHDFKKSLQKTYSFWNKLSSVENELNRSFDPAQLGKINENARDVEELFLLLVEKKAVRLDGKLTSTESTGIEWGPNVHAIDVGEALDATFKGESTYSICGQSIVIYTANLVSNAIVKEITKNEDGATRILYGDTDSMPMYISYTGFKTCDEADKECGLIMESEGLKEKYTGAFTASEYLRQEKLA
jgi:hypothetical protein